MNKTNRLFEKWLRNVFSAKSNKRPKSPERYILQNGERAHPSVKEMKWQIAVDHNILMKEKPIPADRLTNASHRTAEPYNHLQMLVIN